VATNNVTLLDGTTAYASDVEDKVNPLYTDIDNSNIAAGAGIVASKIAGGTFSPGTYSFAGSTITDLGTILTIDIDGGTIDGTVIGGAVAADGTFVTLGATTANITTANITNAAITTLTGQPALADFTNMTHTHAAAATGGTLTWANALVVADAGNHTHASNLQGNTLLWTDIFSVVSAGDHDHTSTTTGGALGATSLLAHNHSSAGTGGNILGTCQSIEVGSLRLASTSIEDHLTATNYGAVRLNQVGYGGGTTYARNTLVYDGKGAIVAQFAGLSKDTFISGSAGNGNLYVAEAVSNLPTSGADMSGTAISANKLICGQAVAKAWVTFTCGPAGGTTIHEAYNVASVDQASSTITFGKDFAFTNYFCMGHVTDGLTKGALMRANTKNAGTTVVISDAWAGLQVRTTYEFIWFGTLVA